MVKQTVCCLRIDVLGPLDDRLLLNLTTGQNGVSNEYWRERGLGVALSLGVDAGGSGVVIAMIISRYLPIAFAIGKPITSSISRECRSRNGYRSLYDPSIARYGEQ